MMNAMVPIPDAPHCPGEPLTVLSLAWIPNADGSAVVCVNWGCTCGHVAILEATHRAAAEPRAASAGMRTTATVREGARARREVRATAYGEVRGIDTRDRQQRADARARLEQLRGELKEAGAHRHDEIDGEIDSMLAELEAADRREDIDASGSAEA